MARQTQLLLMRHGEAELHAASDSLRPLSARGIEEARRAGAWLARQALDITLVCHSPYLRAQQTAEQVSHTLGQPQQSQLDVLVPSGQPLAVLEAIENLDTQTVLCVSHQPLVGNLRNLLVAGHEGAGYPFLTASIALLSCDFLIAAGATMDWIRYPSDFE
jgi:phosphohistidine phosphatase